MIKEFGRILWHTTPIAVDRKRYFEPITMTAALAALTAAAGTAGVGAGIGSAFGLFGGKKKDRNVSDPLASLRLQLQNLAGEIPGQVAKQKENTAQRIATARTEGMQGINENIRAERGFGDTSLQDRLNAELADKLLKTQTEADLNSDIWGTKTQADILSGTAGMYPTTTELPEEADWGANLLGTGANMAVQNWQQDNMWKNLSKYLNPTSGTSVMGGGNTGGVRLEDLLASNLGSNIMKI